MVGERVLLKVSPMKGVNRFGKKGKLSPRYIGPFEIVESVLVRWRISWLCHLGGAHVIQWDSVLLEQKLTFEKEPVTILDRQIRKLRSKEIASVKLRERQSSVGDVVAVLAGEKRREGARREEMRRGGRREEGCCFSPEMDGE
ncbi:uncharacterized protein LOC125839912 [Solanum verrucosum]|uniref:uncharacterized protein LOC125839912 n=1 Tax=Solanum verrucosum TaxID=315347 RepID=UPI0020D1BED5|nr:uncharacterized protein LOC125839912 [Solanum verrucosum]